jgi:glycosyltransferase involved in cell wall biosynthesis
MTGSPLADPAVSVIIPTYNHRDWIIETLDSVFAQTYRDFEVIIVNDGSPDDTNTVVKRIVEERGIRYFDQPNAGQAHARNEGLAQARGEFIAFLDDDDLWPPDKLEWQAEVLNTYPDAVMVYGGMRFVDAGHDTAIDPGPDAPAGAIREQFLRRNRIWSPGQTLIRRSAMREIGPLDESVWGADDWDMYIRLAGVGRVEYRNRLALRYRKHIGNASGNSIRMYFSQRKVFRKHMGMAIWRDRDIRRESRGASAAYCLPILEQALIRRSNRKYLSAWYACLLAVVIKPSLLKSRFFWRERFKPLITGAGAAANR